MDYHFDHEPDSLSRRETFSFDKKFYRDSRVEVTPCVLILYGRYLPCLFRKVIPVQDINLVRLDAVHPKSWRTHKLFTEDSDWIHSEGAESRNLKGRRQSHADSQLVIQLKGEKFSRVIGRCENPDDAYAAICDAMDTLY